MRAAPPAPDGRFPARAPSSLSEHLRQRAPSVYGRYTALNNESLPSPISKQCRVAYFFLFTALLSSCVAFPLHNYTLPRWFSFYLFSLYGTFLLVSVLVESEVIPKSALCSWLPYGPHGVCQDES